MSANATDDIWKVTIESGSVYSLRTGEWLFTNERAAKAFRAAAIKALPKRSDTSIEKIEVYKNATAALFQGWPFDELREAAEAR